MNECTLGVAANQNEEIMRSRHHKYEAAHENQNENLQLHRESEITSLKNIHKLANLLVLLIAQLNLFAFVNRQIQKT